MLQRPAATQDFDAVLPREGYQGLCIAWIWGAVYSSLGLQDASQCMHFRHSIAGATCTSISKLRKAGHNRRTPHNASHVASPCAFSIPPLRFQEPCRYVLTDPKWAASAPERWQL